MTDEVTTPVVEEEVEGTPAENTEAEETSTDEAAA